MSTTRTTSRPAHTVVTALVERHLVDPENADLAESVVEQTLAQPHQVVAVARPATRRSALIEIAGYAGGALVLAALGLLVAEHWGGFSRHERLAAVSAVAVFLLGAGVVIGLASGGVRELREASDAARRRVTSTLLSAGAVAAGAAAGMAVDLWVDGSGEGQAFAFGLTVTVLAVAAYLVAPSALGQLVILAGLTTAVNTGLWLAVQVGDVGYAFGLLAVAALWLAAAQAGVLRERTLAYVLGMGTALVGAQFPVGGDQAAVGYVLTAVVAAVGFGWYLRSRAWPFVAAGVVAVTIVVPEAIVDWTEGSLGVAGAVLVTGLTLLAASLAGFRASRSQ